MKLHSINNNFNNSHCVTFKAGVTNFYMDYKMDYLGKEVFDDVREGKFTEEAAKELNARYSRFGDFCTFAEKNSSSGTAKFVFNSFIFNNHHESAVIIAKLLNNKVRIPLPDVMITDKGGGVFNVTPGLGTKTTAHNVFTNTGESGFTTHFVSQSGNWDFKNIAEQCRGALITAVKDANVLHKVRLFRHILGTNNLSHEQAQKMLEELIESNMDKDELMKRITSLWEENCKLSNKEEIRPNMAQKIEKLCDAILGIREKSIHTISLQTISKKYPSLIGCEGEIAKNANIVTRDNYIMPIGDNGFKYSAVLPSFFQESRDNVNLVKTLNQELSNHQIDAVIKVTKRRENFDHPTVSIKPRIDGRKLDCVSHVKSALEEIQRTGSNDLIIVTATRESSPALLNLYNYVYDKKVPSEITPDKLKEVFKLPIVAIFLDDSTAPAPKTEINGLRADLSQMDKIFNADGNVRFIHVTPKSVKDGKPKTLEDAILLAQQSYANRNEAFRNALPEQILDLLEYEKATYPMDRKLSSRISEFLKEDVWRPAVHWVTNDAQEETSIIQAKSLYERIKERISRNKVLAGLALACIISPLLNNILNRLEQRNAHKK